MPQQPNIPLGEEFNELSWQNYTSFEDTTKQHLPFQKHLDIRPFTETRIKADGGDFLAPEEWVLPIEEPQESNTGPQEALKHFPALKLKITNGVVEATSAVPDHSLNLATELEDARLVFALPKFPLAHVNIAKSYIELIDDEHNVYQIAFNRSEKELTEGETSFEIKLKSVLVFRSTAKSSTGVTPPYVDLGGVFQQRLPAKLTFGENETSSLLYRLNNITTIRFRLEGTAADTVYIAGLRLIPAPGANPEVDPGWQQSTIDFDNWNGRLHKPVPLDNLEDKPAFALSTLWKSASLEGPYDPQPIDSEFGIVINTGSLQATNNFTMYFRQQAKLFTTMIDLVGVSMAELDGQPMPDLGERQFLPRTMSELDHQEMEKMDKFEMEELERRSVANPVLESWIYFSFSWNKSVPTIFMGNNSGVGYNFPGLESAPGKTVTLKPNHNYFVVFTLEGSKARARLFDMYQELEDGPKEEGGLEESEPGVFLPNERYFRVIQEPLFDTTIIDEDDIFRRRKGRLGFSATFNDNDAFVRSYRPRGVTFAEYASAPLLSHTPVVGAQLFVNSSNTSLHEGGELALYPEGTTHAVESIDKSRSTTKGGFSYKVTNKGVPKVGEYQGLMTEFMEFTDLAQAQISFSLWFSGPAREKERIETTYHGFYPGHKSFPGKHRLPGPKTIITSEPTFASIIARLVSTDGTVIPLTMPELETNQWQNIVLRFPDEEVEVIQTGWYQLQILQQTRLATSWWVDNLAITQRDVAWSARSVSQTPWEDEFAPWTPFLDVVTDKQHNSGIIIEPRGKELQLRAEARKQTAQFQMPKLVPRYAQLGRLVWPETKFNGTKPTAKFKAAVAGKEVTFTDESTEGTGVLTKHEWTFGDGARLTSNASKVTHKYSHSAPYNATLLVIDRNGLKDAYTAEVEPT